MAFGEFWYYGYFIISTSCLLRILIILAVCLVFESLLAVFLLYIWSSWYLGYFLVPSGILLSNLLSIELWILEIGLALLESRQRQTDQHTYHTRPDQARQEKRKTRPGREKHVDKQRGKEQERLYCFMHFLTTARIHKILHSLLRSTTKMRLK